MGAIDVDTTYQFFTKPLRVNRDRVDATSATTSPSSYNIPLVVNLALTSLIMRIFQVTFYGKLEAFLLKKPSYRRFWIKSGALST